MHLISAGHLDSFRVTAAPAEPQVAGLALEKVTQEKLAISAGHRIQWVAL
jgi:arginine N-succinyltransferase